MRRLAWVMRLGPLAAASVMLMSCAQLGVGSAGLAMDPNDACYQQRAAFNNSPHFMSQKILTGAGVGALAGAAGGAGIAAATHRDPLTGAIVGGLIGAASGAFVGYMQGLQQQNLDKAQLAQRVNSDITAEGTDIDRIAVAFGDLRDCRFTQANIIKSAERGRRIPFAMAHDELEYQRARFAEELALARSYNVNMTKHEDQFQDAAATLRKQNAPNSARIEKVATETIPEKRGHFTNAVDSADSTAKVAFNLDDSTKSSWLWLMLGYA